MLQLILIRNFTQLNRNLYQLFFRNSSIPVTSYLKALDLESLSLLYNLNKLTSGD